MPQTPSASNGGLSRRQVLIAGPVLGGAAVMLGCDPANDRPHSEDHDVRAPDRGPLGPEDTPSAEEFRFLREEEVISIDAVVARIIPGDDDDPGAVQAGVTIYIDEKLASFEEFAEPTFMQEPHAEESNGEDSPEGDSVVLIESGQLYRYGYQSKMLPREVYRLGLQSLDRYAQSRFGAAFVELTEKRQDELLATLDDVQQRSEDDENGNGFDDGELDRAEEIFAPVDPGYFFTTVRTDTIEGMFADPIYGGNRGLVGWTLIGYPGGQRSYSPNEMRHGTNKQPVSMEGLTPMNPDRVDGGQEALERHHHHVDEG